MRKAGIIIVLCFVAVLWGCSERVVKVVQDVDLNGGRFYESERDLFLPIPYKNNSVFLGWSLSDKDEKAGLEAEVEYFGSTKMASISPETFKQYSENSLVVFEPQWLKIETDALFTYKYIESMDAYEVSFDENHMVYPREITIPSTYQGKKVFRIADRGFANLEDLLIVHLGEYMEEIGIGAFHNTSLFQINTHKKMKIAKDSFADTLMGQKLTPVKGIEKKRITLGHNNYFISTNLKEEHMIEEEFELFLPVPLKENMVFTGWVQNDQVLGYPHFGFEKAISGNLISLKALLEKHNQRIVAEWESYEVSEFDLLVNPMTNRRYLVLNKIAYPREINLQKYSFSAPVSAILDFKQAPEVAIVKLASTIDLIRKDAFQDTKLYEIVMTDSVTEIEANAFANTFLGVVNMPRELERLGESVFYNTMVKRLEIPNSLRDIDPTAFLNTRDLEFIVSNIHPQYTVIPDAGNRMMFSKDEKTLLFASLRNDITVIRGVETIGEWVFAKSRYNRISLPNTVRTFEKYSFYQSTVQNGVTIPSELEEIKDYAFLGYQSNQHEMKFSSRLKKIGVQAFRDSNVYSYEFEEGLLEIGERAFYRLSTPWMDPLSDEAVVNSKINVPASVTTIGRFALNWFDHITFEGPVEDLGLVFDIKSPLKQFNSQRIIVLPKVHFENMKLKILSVSLDKDIYFASLDE